MVTAILQDVRRRGDAALLEYTRRFDRVDVADAAALELPRADLQAALDALGNASAYSAPLTLSTLEDADLIFLPRVQRR